MEQLRVLNRVVFPVTYTDKFYNSLLADGNSDWTQLGGVGGRLGRERGQHSTTT